MSRSPITKPSWLSRVPQFSQRPKWYSVLISVRLDMISPRLLVCYPPLSSSKCGLRSHRAELCIRLFDGHPPPCLGSHAGGSVPNGIGSSLGWEHAADAFDEDRQIMHG